MALARTVTLLTIELHREEEWQVRSLLLPSESVPSQEEIEYYYRYMLGLTEYTVKRWIRTVPETFHVGLIGSLVNEAPQAWPHMDKVFDNLTDYERYHALLDRVAEIEFLRLNCGVVKEEESNISLADRILVESKLASVSASSTKPASKREEWIKAVLEALNDEWDIDHDEAAKIQESDTIAWIFAPLWRDARNEKGFRILLHLTAGAEWASKVATGLYPDITVCRRISIVNWSMSTEDSRAMVHQIMRWYIRSQVLDAWDESISPWILNAVFDVDRLLQPFRKIEYSKYTVQPPAEQQTIPKLLQRIEDTHLFAATSAEMCIYEPSESEWMSYTYHVVRAASQGLFAFEKCEDFVRTRIQEWMRTRRGINLYGPSFIRKWAPLWEITLLNRPEKRQGGRFELFLKSLDVLDPTKSCLMKDVDSRAFLKLWIDLFVEKEIVADTKEVMHMFSTPMMDATKAWIYQYIPESFAKQYLRSPLITKSMKEAGFSQLKGKTPVFKYCVYRKLTAIMDLLKDTTPHKTLLAHRYADNLEKVMSSAAVITTTTTTTTTTPDTPITPTIPSPFPTLQIHEAIETGTVHLGSL